MKRNGQAIVEFVVAIIAVIVLVAGMVQIGILSKAHTDVMAEARESAGEHSITPIIGGDVPDYVGTVQDGPDEVNYSADDLSPRGNTSDLQGGMLAYANPADMQEAVGSNMMTTVFLDPFRLMDGFVNGKSSTNVLLLPVIRGLVSGAESLDVKADVWMVRIGDVP